MPMLFMHEVVFARNKNNRKAFYSRPDDPICQSGLNPTQNKPIPYIFQENLMGLKAILRISCLHSHCRTGKRLILSVVLVRLKLSTRIIRLVKIVRGCTLHAALMASAAFSLQRFCSRITAINKALLSSTRARFACAMRLCSGICGKADLEPLFVHFPHTRYSRKMCNRSHVCLFNVYLFPFQVILAT